MKFIGSKTKTGKSIYIMLSILCTIAIPSCSGKKQDNAPKHYIDANRIPNAVPKIEKLDKKVNPSSYTVKGVKYNILKTALGYDEIGKASWYGTKFHGKLTSTGEKYDMLSMTAANKVLPIPCYAEVTNLNNKKKIIVKINDRGPFVEGRIIDLSYAAAKKLGIIANGTATVRVKTIDPRKFRHTKTKSKVKTKLPELYLQVASLSSSEAAKHMQQKITKTTMLLSKVEKTSNSGKFSYKVKVGPFKNYTVASQAKNLLLKNNFPKEISFVS